MDVSTWRKQKPKGVYDTNKLSFWVCSRISKLLSPNILFSSVYSPQQEDGLYPVVYTETTKPMMYCELLKSSQLWFHNCQVWVILWPFEGWVWNVQSGYKGAGVTHTLIGECVANASLSFDKGANIQAQGGGTLKLTVC